MHGPTAHYLINRKWLFLFIALILLLMPLFLSDFRVSLLGRYLSFAILVIGLDLLWGYTGVLSLGHGIFFGLGAYIMAIYLKLEASSGIPDFMVWNGITELPWFWALLQNPVIAIAGGILFPMILAALLGFFLLFETESRMYISLY